MTREEVESIIENLSSDSDESSIDKAIQVVDHQCVHADQEHRIRHFYINEGCCGEHI